MLLWKVQGHAILTKADGLTERAMKWKWEGLPKVGAGLGHVADRVRQEVGRLQSEAPETGQIWTSFRHGGFPSFLFREQGTEAGFLKV